MYKIDGVNPAVPAPLKKAVLREISKIPAIGWLAGLVGAVLIEYQLGDSLAHLLSLPKVPALFGFNFVLRQPALFPAAIAYVVLVYAVPILLIAKLSAKASNRVASGLERLPLWFSTSIHLAMMYLCLHLWTDLSDYRLQVVKLIMIAVMLTLSINVINGYMGEFSCSHPGFVALGAYVATAFSLVLFTNDRFFGAAWLPPGLGPFFFPLALIIGGGIAAVGALVVAIPSFRTRGDYLAIISLAFMFIVKSIFENMEILGGPRGLGGQPHWSTLPVVFIVMSACILIINNFVSSTYGKALNAVRDNEMAADAMTVNTRRTKMIAFMFGAFWAGVAGGLYAHEVRHVTPGSFGIQMLAEILAMVYFGGLNSVVGSIVGAVSISMVSEILKPLGLYKWIIIPLVLILVMIYRPTGLIAFREFNLKQIMRPRS